MKDPKKGILPSHYDLAEKQKLLYSKEISPERRVKIAELLIQEGKYCEALEYLEQAKDEGKIKEVMEKAVEEGDYFSLAYAEKVSGLKVEADRWNRLGAQAEKLGKYSYALKAYKAANNTEKYNKLKEKLTPSEGEDLKPSLSDEEGTQNE